MANCGSENSGPRELGHGNREQFDHFDRLSEVDQKDLNTDKMKAGDKEANIEALLATEDETSVVTNELEGGGVESDALALDLDLYDKDHNEIPPIDEMESATTPNQPELTIDEDDSAALIITPPIQPPSETIEITVDPLEATSVTDTIEDDTPPPVAETPEPIPEIEEEDDLPPEEETPEPPELPQPPIPPNLPNVTIQGGGALGQNDTLIGGSDGGVGHGGHGNPHDDGETGDPHDDGNDGDDEDGDPHDHDDPHHHNDDPTQVTT